ncbi:MAG: hypothetical protein ACFFAO_19580, partial [Candidatus Hermodarchaeota archaeon]
DHIIVLLYPDIEPLYSLDYLSKLVSSVLMIKFPKTREDRYEDFTFEGFTYRTWITPSIEDGIMMMLIYTIVCLSIAALIFKRRQL